MDGLTRKIHKPIDLRAPDRLAPRLLSWDWQKILTLLVADVLALAIAWKVAAFLNRFYSPLPPQLDWGIWLGLPGLFWLFAVVTLVVFAKGGLYQSPTQWKNYLRSGQLVSFVYLLSLVVQYFYDPKLDPPRSLVITAWVSSIGLTIGFRLIAALLLKQLEPAQNQVSVFLIAPAHRLAKLAKILQRQPHYKIVGAALSTTASSATTLRSILKSNAQEVLAENLPHTELASALYWQLRRARIALRLIPSSVETLHRRGVPEIFAGVPTVRVEPPFLNGWDYRLKRSLDFGGAAVGMIGLAPLLIGVAIAIKATSPGAIFFRQERMGLHGKVFRVWKFRTMSIDAPQLQISLEEQNQTCDGVMFKIKDDPRVTSVGHFLRRTSLDELPQLLNVLLGQMSLVGPRPLPLRDVARFESWHHIRHQVLPGITGLWQISGRSDIENFNDAARLDLYYIDHWSLNLDLDILMETIRIVLFGKGAY
ncbi:MAG: sugar transferase [Leptolyngbyaceae cyanobacterium CSU_1_3]|nr:sugar transferase [Leptolyngbyaceae cyanobacterium CSU_1_3]